MLFLSVAEHGTTCAHAVLGAVYQENAVSLGSNSSLALSGTGLRVAALLEYAFSIV